MTAYDLILDAVAQDTVAKVADLMVQHHSSVAARNDKLRCVIRQAMETACDETRAVNARALPAAAPRDVTESNP